MNYGIEFFNAKNQKTSSDLRMSSFFNGAGMPKCYPFFCVSRFPTGSLHALTFLEGTDTVDLSITYMQEKTLLVCSQEEVALLRQVAVQYLENPTRQEDDLSVQPFYAALLL